MAEDEHGEGEADPVRLYREARPHLKKATKHYAKTVSRLLRGEVPDYYVTKRVKTARSVVRKLREDPLNPRAWDSITDLAGVRVICSTKSDCKRADRLICDGPWVIRKRERMKGKYNRLFYPGIHIEVVDASQVDHRSDPITCEIQIRTRAQDAWAVASHKLSYKGAVKPPPKMRRLIDRLTILVEVFDDEVQRLFKKRARLPMYREAILLEFLENRYEDLSGNPAEGVKDLSIINVLLVAYGDDEPAQQLVDEFCDAHVGLSELIGKHSVTSETYQDRADWLYTQPEVLLVLERASSKAHRLSAAIEHTDLEDVVRRTCTSAGVVLP